jgi:hypothetical protein
LAEAVCGYSSDADLGFDFGDAATIVKSKSYFESLGVIGNLPAGFDSMQATFTKSRSAVGKLTLMFKKLSPPAGGCDYINGNNDVTPIAAGARAFNAYGSCTDLKSAAFSCEFNNATYMASVAEEKARQDEREKAKKSKDRALMAAGWGALGGAVVGAGTGVAVELAKDGNAKSIAAAVTGGTTLGATAGAATGFLASGDEDYRAAGTAMMAGGVIGGLAAGGTSVLARTGNGTIAKRNMDEEKADADANASALGFALPVREIKAGEGDEAAGCEDIVKDFKSLVDSERAGIEAYIEKTYKVRSASFPALFTSELSTGKENLRECYAYYSSIGHQIGYTRSEEGGRSSNTSFCIDRRKYTLGGVSIWLEKSDGSECKTLVGYVAVRGAAVEAVQSPVE